MHPEWLDDDTLVFEADEASTPNGEGPAVRSRHLLTFRLSSGIVTAVPHPNARLGASFEQVRVVSHGLVVQVPPDVGPAEEPLHCESAPSGAE